MTDRSIACILITHLPVKAEVRRYPQLRGKPVIITESYGSKDLVLDSSPEARGVSAGMPLAEAMASGIYGGDAHAIEMAAAFPTIANLEREHGSLLRGVMARPTAEMSSSKRSSARVGITTGTPSE